LTLARARRQRRYLKWIAAKGATRASAKIGATLPVAKEKGRLAASLGRCMLCFIDTLFDKLFAVAFPLISHPF
jgi:hypothetical protein